MRRLQPGRYRFDDVEVGDIVETPSRTLTAADIDAFAALTGDRFEIHMDDEAARRHGFPARVAHGLLVVSIIDGLKNAAPAQFEALASLEWTFAFRNPIFAGDTLAVEVSVAEKRTVSNPARGILGLAFDVLREGDVVQRGRNLLMVYR
ncbi:MAG: MaoC family dehydratase [Acuticoccus sp.]